MTNFLEVQILGLQNAACSVRNPTMSQIKAQRKASRVGHIYKCPFVRIEIYCLQDFLYFKGFPNQFDFIIMNVLQFLVLSLNNKTGSGVKDPIEFAILI